VPKYRITAPDGKTYNVTVPEGQDVNPEAILGALKARTTPKPMSQDEYGTAKAANMAGLGFGVGDEVLAGLGSVFRQDLGNYDEQLKYIRGSQDKLNREDFGASITSNLIGGIPAAIATGGPAAGFVSKVLPNVGRVGNAAVTGAGFAGAAGFGSGEGGVQNRAVSAALAAPIGAGLGATVEGVVSPAVSRFITYLRGKPQLIDPATKQLTQQGQQIAQRAGIDPDQLSVQMQREFADTAQRATSPQALNQAGVIAEAGSLPVPVKLTQGQVDLLPEQQMLESQMAKDAYGRLAGERMRSAFSAQDEALQGNMEAIRARITGGTQFAEPGQRGLAIQQPLAQMRDAAEENVRSLYTASRQGQDASIEPGTYRQAVQNIIGDVTDNFAPADIPKVFSKLEGMQKASMQAGSSETLVSSVFRTRRQLVSLQAEGGAEGAAAGAAKRSLDNWLVNSLDEAAISGDKEAINRARQAISAFRDYKTKFDGEDLVSKLVERDQFSSTLKNDPETAISVIFGRSDTGFFSKANVARDLVKMKGLLGENSEGWKALKDEALTRILRSSDGGVLPDSRGFSGAKLVKTWQAATDKHPEVLRQLFTEQERALISQFVRVAQRVTTTVPGGSNTSNTSAGLMQAVRRMFSSAVFGPKLAALIDSTPVLKGLQDIAYEMKATRSAIGQMQVGAQPTLPLGQVSPQADAALRAAVPLGAQMGGNRQ